MVTRRPVLVLLLLFAGCAGPDEAGARAAAEQIVPLVLAGDADRLWSEFATPAFREACPREKLEAQLRQIRDKLGPFEAHAPTRLVPANDSHGGRFETRTACVWTLGYGDLVLTLAPVGREWKLHGFRVYSPQL